MKTGAFKYYELNSELSKENEILSITELEENYIALCSEVIIRIYFYDGKIYTNYMTIDEKEKYLSYLLYTKDKKLLVQTEENIKIYDINLKDKKYELLQIIELNTSESNPIELSNGDIATADNSAIKILGKVNNNDKILYEIKSISELKVGIIEYIIECNDKEICFSSGYSELIGFIDKKTLKCDTFKHLVGDGFGVLCMVNKEIMLIINKQREGLTLINVPKRKIILNYKIEYKIEIYHYAIKLSDNHILIACQEEWMKKEKHPLYPFRRYKNTVYKDIIEIHPINLKHFYFEEDLEFLENLEIDHFEDLNVLIYAKNKHIITNSLKIQISNWNPGYGFLDEYANPKIYKFKLDKDIEAKAFYTQVEKIENSINYEQFKEILKNISTKYEMDECPEEESKKIFGDHDKIPFKFFKMVFNTIWNVKFDYSY